MSMQLVLLSLYPLVLLFFLYKKKQTYKFAPIAILSIGLLFALPVLHTQAQSTPYNGSARTIPGTIEAEDFDAGGEGVGYHDVDAANQALQYRPSEGVDIETNPTGGYDVGWTANGEWMKYTVSVQTTGSYTLQVRAGTPYSGESLRVEMDGATIATVAIPVTGSWQAWQNIGAGNVSLTAGTHVMRIYVENAGFNIDSVTFAMASTSTNNAPTANAGSDKFITLPTNSVTLSGSGSDSDGTISSYAWTKTAGGTATITSPSSASTTIGGLTQGTYNFRLTVTDNGGLTAFDDVLVTVSSSSPVQVKSTTPGGGYAVTITDPNGGTYSAYLHLPSDYNTSTKTYPLVVFLHGVGEAGTDLSLIYNNSNAGGPAYFAEHNGMGAYVNPADGKSYEFIVLAPQTTWDSTSGASLEKLLQGFVPTYRVDTNRVYITGLSAGGKGTLEYMLHSGWTPTYPIPATVPMSEALTIQSGWGANVASQGIRVWGFGSDPADTWGTQTKILVNDMNAAVPGIARYTNYSGGHCCWGTYYNPAYKETINGVSMNIYQWMLQYKGGSATIPPTNSAPTANAGADKTITLPTSSTSLSGSGADSDGTIASYAWSQQFGPNTATISSPNSANTNVSNLIAGSYRFRLTVTDNGGATAYDDVNVSVDAAPTATQSPYGGSARAIPGQIEAEDFDTGGEGVAYHDSTNTNVGGAYRTSDAVDMEASYDTGGGYTVGWTTDGEWIEYTVNVQASGPYSIDARVATPNTGKTIQYSMDGTLIGSMTVANTGGWQTWQTQTLSNISLTAGNHVLRITFVTGSTTDTNAGVNINYIKFTAGATVNMPPTANAGSDQIIVLPTTSVTLSGSGTDTGGSIASYAWTKTAGGTATIASPSSATTTISGLTQGTYTFRLTVTDNTGLTGTDDVIVTVNAQVPLGSQVRIPIDPATMVINENVVGNETKLFNEQSLLQLDANGNPVTTSTNPAFCPDIWNEPKGQATCWSIFDNQGVREISWPAKLTIDLKATYSVTDAYVYMSGPSANGTNDAIEIRASDDPFNFANKVGGSKLVTQYPYSQWVRVPLTTNNNRYLELVITQDAGKIAEIVFIGTKTGTTVSDNTPNGAWQESHYTMDTAIGTNVSFGMGDGYDKDYDYQWGTLRNYGGFRWTFDVNDNLNNGSGYNYDTEMRRIASGSGVKSYSAQMGAAQSMVDPADPNYNNGGVGFTDRKPIDYTLCKGTVLVNGVASCLGIADQPASYAHKAWLDKKYAMGYGSNSVYKQEFIELGNESDGSWNQAGYFNPYELAAMMSADYDGHCDVLRYNGEHVGVKNGDPKMKVMMPGLVSMGSGDMRYLNAMNFWWQHNRPCAQKIPADVINFHFYASSSGGQGNASGIGISPEDYGMRDMMKKTVKFRNDYAPKADVAVTEYGYDSYPQVFPDPTVSWCKDAVYGGSIIATHPIGSYDSDEVAGQWITRTILEMAAAGIDFSNQFWLGDEYKLNTVCGTFAASGLLKQPLDAINWRPQYVPRPGWYYVQTLRTQLKGMKYDSDKKVNGISVMKFRDVANTNRVAYAVWSPTSTGYTNNAFTLNLDRAGAAQVVKLATGSETGQIDQTTTTQVSSIVIPVSERPILVIVNENGTIVGGPVVSAGIDQSITLPTNSVTLTGSATSANTISSYAWTKTAGGTATISSPSNATTTVSGLTQGTYTFHLVVTDNTGATGMDDVNVVVLPKPNTAPAVNAGVDQTITLPVNSVSLTGTAVDADNDSMTYAWTKTAGGVATITAPSSLTTMISGLAQGTYTFMLTATDAQGAAGTDTVTITVNGAPNISPVANAGVDQVLTRLSGSFTLTGSGTDADGTIASYRWTQVSGPTATILTPTTASTKVSAASVGVYIFRLTVTDNLGAVGTDDVSVTAQSVKVNKNPHVKAATTSPITTTSTSLTLTGTASDEDGTIASTEWTQVSGPQASIASPTNLQTTISGLDSSTYEFTLTATDNEGGIATDTVRVIASRPATSGGGGGGGGSSGGGSTRSDERPTVSAGGDQTITLPISSVVLNGTGSDAEGSVTYEWKQLSGHSGTKIDSAKSAKTTVSGLTEGRYVFGLTVTDKKGQESTDQAVVVVLKAEAVPTATGGNNSNRVKINVQTTLRVRADASISSDVLGSVRGGVAGVVLQQKTGPTGIQWLQVQFDNGTTGWVSKSYTIPDQSVTAPVRNTNTTLSTRATITARLLNVRASAGGPVIGQITSGNGGTVISDTGSWVQMQFDNGTTGWVSKAYTSSVSGGGAVSTPSTGTVTTTAASLNVRTAPGGAVVGKVPFGTTGTVINRVNGWVLAQFPTVTGYVSSAYVR